MLASKYGMTAQQAEQAQRQMEQRAAADEAMARSLGVTGVPFFVIDRRYGVSGAQPADTITQVLEKAWGEH